MATTTGKKELRNYNANFEMIPDVITVFRKTDNVERLINILATQLNNNEFRYLFATEFANVPLTVRFVNEETN